MQEVKLDDILVPSGLKKIYESMSWWQATVYYQAYTETKQLCEVFR